MIFGGAFRINNVIGSKRFVTSTDNYNRLPWVFLMKEKYKFLKISTTWTLPNLKQESKFLKQTMEENIVGAIDFGSRLTKLELNFDV